MTTTFFVVGHTQPADPAAVSLDDLAGTSGRWDVLARCVTAALLVSHGVRDDAEVVLYLRRGERYVRVVGDDVTHLNPDERSTAALVAKALAAQPVGAHEENPHPGIHVGEGGLGDVLARIAGARPVLRMDEAGDAQATWPADAVYVLADHEDFDEEDLEAVGNAPTATLGPTALQADQAIVVAHDRIATARR